jgi:hypothetical protein
MHFDTVNHGHILTVPCENWTENNVSLVLSQPVSCCWALFVLPTLSNLLITDRHSKRKFLYATAMTLRTMKKTYNKALELFLIALLSTSINAQTKEYKVISKEMSFDLKNDTLYSTKGLKIFVGQKFVEGNAVQSFAQKQH